MPEVELRGLTKRYPGAAADALRDVDLAVRSGERFVVVGPSGSGKSTLLRLIAGLEAPTRGSVAIGGRVVDGLPPRERRVGFVFQSPPLLPHLDVAGNLAFGLRARGVPRREADARAAAIAGPLGLLGRLDRKPATLSGGERQRVAIGRAVLPGPAVLLLDEPFSGLDAPLRASTRATLLGLRLEGSTTTILVTHDQTEALAVGERIAVLRDGRVEQVGTPRDLYERPANRFVAAFLGDPPMAFLPCRFVDEAATILDGQALRPAPDLGRADAILGLRPEAVRLQPEASWPGASAMATIERNEPRGHESIAWLRVDGHPIAARVGPRFDGRPGESVAIGFDLFAASWFATVEGEARIARTDDLRAVSTTGEGPPLA